MFYLNQIDTRPSGYYSVPVDKNTYSFQPIKAIHSTIDSSLQQHATQIALQTASSQIKRTITVTGQGELKMPPDQVRLVVAISSVKPKVDEAKNSVHRRFEYVYQTLRKQRIMEADIYVTTANYRRENGYEVVTEISTTFSDFPKYLKIYNILIEKLDKTVKVMEPQFSHTPARIDAVKRQTTIQAIRNAKRIGFDLANSVNLALGKPIEINQESFKEYYGFDVTTSAVLADPAQKSLNDLVNEKTITMMATVKSVFELKPRRIEK